MSATSRPGVFVAGAATGPETIDDFDRAGSVRRDGGADAWLRSSLLEAAE